MATQYTDHPNRSARPAQRPSSGRPSGAGRPSGSRPAGQRPPQGSRPSGSRPSGGNRRPLKRRKRKAQSRFYVFLAVAAIVLIALVALIVHFVGGSGDPTSNAQPTAAPVVETDAPLTDADASDDASQTTANHADSLAAMLGDQDATLEGLSDDELAKVEDLSINESLPKEWMNILLLGSDERKLTSSARTDSMIICSIHLPTGEVKLTSIMRDLAVNFDDIGKYNGTYRINAANYFGGEELAMKTVNECFNLNIDKYVRVNFYGFQKVAQMLGGVDMTITEAEMNLINKYSVEQAKFAYYNDADDSAIIPYALLETYGENVHLDGRQTLAYARIRKLDGGDYARAERQRKVLVALMNKVQNMELSELVAVANESFSNLRTNLTLDEILAVAMQVMKSGLSDVDTFRLPINDSYVQESRNNQSMFYDCDWTTNANELYSFIYG